MIKTTNLTVNGRPYILTQSTEGRYVVRDGISYEEAIDPAQFERTYTEGDFIIHDLPDDAELSDDQIVSILTGGSV